MVLSYVANTKVVSGFASNIYFPALPTIARDLNVPVELVNLTVTSYLIFQGLAPSLWAPYLMFEDDELRTAAHFWSFSAHVSAWRKRRIMLLSFY